MVITLGGGKTTAGRRQKLGEFQQLRNYLLKGIGAHDVLGHLLSMPKEGWEKQNPGGGGTPYIGLRGQDPPKRGTFFRLQVYKWVGISRVKVYERVGKSSFGY